LVLGAAYFLKLYRKAFFGQVSNRVVAEAVDLRRHELIVVSVFAVLVIFLGLYPALVLDLIQQSSQDWIGRLTPQR
jgi:NADH-quinone oxidoreductase subunit M